MHGRISLKWAVIAAVVIAAGVFYFRFDPMTTSFAPQCIFHRLTGLQCAGCGSQRMIHAMLHGNFQEAFRANALAMVSLPVLAFFVAVDAWRGRLGWLHRRIYSTPTIIAAVGAICIWTIARNLF